MRVSFLIIKRWTREEFKLGKNLLGGKATPIVQKITNVAISMHG